MTTYSELRAKVNNTAGLLAYTISKVEISASEMNYKKFTDAVQASELLLQDVRSHINELKFLSELQSLKHGSFILKSKVTNGYCLLNSDGTANVDYMIVAEIITDLMKRYKFLKLGENDHFIKYELIRKIEWD